MPNRMDFPICAGTPTTVIPVQNFQRPGFQAMLADIEAGKVGTVIVKDMSRLGRNYLQVGMYTEMIFPQKGVRFIAINDGVDSAQGDNDFAPLRNIL